MSLASKVKGKMPKKRDRSPVWKGPEVDGVTQSLLSRFLVCRERFRILAIEGLKSGQEFSARMEYGNMWHACEEAHAAEENWQTKLMNYCSRLGQQYPAHGNEIAKWYNVCKRQFPIYVRYWASQKDETAREPLLQEAVFDVPYLLPSGRVVRLRGKFDSVDLIGKGKDIGVYIKENKTKGDIDPQAMMRNLKFDLQTMMYTVAWVTLQEYAKEGFPTPVKQYIQKHDFVVLPENVPEAPYKGVRYNVIRRPLSGGLHSIKQKQGSKKERPETLTQYYDRLAGLMESVTFDETTGKPLKDAHYFMRWKVGINTADIRKFEHTCLMPLLESLCEWYDWIAANPSAPWRKHGDTGAIAGAVHYRFPFGVTNMLLEDKHGDTDMCLETGSEIGLRRVDTLFSELE